MYYVTRWFTLFDSDLYYWSYKRFARCLSIEWRRTVFQRSVRL